MAVQAVLSPLQVRHCACPATWLACLAALRSAPQTRAPEGPIEDCCQECDAATVDEATNDFFLPLLNDLATT